MLGADVYSFSADVDFDATIIVKKYMETHSLKSEMENIKTEADMEKFLIDYSDEFVRLMGMEVDRLEEKIKKEVPETKFVDIEAN